MDGPDAPPAPATASPRGPTPESPPPAPSASAAAEPAGWAIPFPIALAALCAGLVLSIWGAVRTGTPALALLGAAVVAALAGLYLVSYSRRPMRTLTLPPIPEEEFDDPVEEADRLDSAPSQPAATPPAGPESPPAPAAAAHLSDNGALPEGAVPNEP